MYSIIDKDSFRISNKFLFNSGNVMVNFGRLFCNNKEQLDSFVNNDLYFNMVSAIVKFISYYEENGLDVIIYLKEMWHYFFKTRQDFIYGVSLIVNFYYDILKCKYELGNYFFSGYDDIIDTISNNNKTSSIINKINICINKIEELKYNLNVNLLLDDMLIKLTDV